MSISVIDDALSPADHDAVFKHVSSPTWDYGWRSNAKGGGSPFLHKHYAGSLRPDHLEKPYDCAAELAKAHPLLASMWATLHGSHLAGHRLVRCYANAFAYGMEGTLHTDCVADHGYTSVYYPAPEWRADWGGETVFFNLAGTDAIGCSFPKPGRLVVFSGRTPHVARGVTRLCPGLRITLMFKTELAP